MQISKLNWMQLEEQLAHDDRAVLPLGSTEQHAYLSLATDAILAERVAAEAAEPLGVPVFPVLPYGMTPAFAAYPGSPTVRTETYFRLVRDLLDALYADGFRRILIVNGHGGNDPARAVVDEWMAEEPDGQAICHGWWLGERVLAVARAIGRPGHASWFENFPWTRLLGVALPAGEKPQIDRSAYFRQNPAGVRALLGDGSFGGPYERPDEDMLRLWQVGVEEVRDLLEHGWR
jgi:creatinine amidohydrolase